MLIDIVKKIVSEQGEQILSDPKRISAFFSDLAKDEPKPQKRAIIKSLEYGYVKVLKGVAKEKRTNCKESLANRLCNEEGLKIELCREAIEIICAVLFGETFEEAKEEEKIVIAIPEQKNQKPTTKECPFCGEAILMIAVKCKHCQSMLGVPQPPYDFRDDKIGIDMAFVKGGTFTMGATAEQGSDSYDDEKPAHSVTLSDFYIGKHEITQRQWFQVMGTTVEQQRNKANPQWPLRGVGDDYPMYYVSWDEAQEFIIKLNQKSGNSYRLPTEAEWEYAARGGSKSKGYKYSGSNNIDDVAWYKSNSSDITHPMGQKLSNELGVCDMSGNVREWVSDWYGGYDSGPQINPIGASIGGSRVIRGGSWFYDARGCRVSYRRYNAPSDRGDGLGFRLVFSL